MAARTELDTFADLFKFHVLCIFVALCMFEAYQACRNAVCAVFMQRGIKHWLGLLWIRVLFPLLVLASVLLLATFVQAAHESNHVSLDLFELNARLQHDRMRSLFHTLSEHASTVHKRFLHA
jgi:uncharacterized BrkB/YihY/UPF0761 family membrane protein